MLLDPPVTGFRWDYGAILLAQFFVVNVGASRGFGFPDCERAIAVSVLGVGVESRFDCENEVTILPMAKECSRLALPYSLGFVEANGLRRYVNLQGVMRGLCVGGFVGMH